MTFLFADLAGYTALTEVHGDEAAADVALAFCDEVGTLLPSCAEDIKMLGDACLIRADDAACAVELAVTLADRAGARHKFPDVRIGMHTGGAVRRGNDWFGGAVNIAARVVELAGAGDVLLTRATRAAAGDDLAVPLDDRGLHELRHLATPQQILAVRRDAAGPWAVDPVCRMRLDASQTEHWIAHWGAEHYFCSQLCAERFAREPGRYGVGQ